LHDLLAKPEESPSALPRPIHTQYMSPPASILSEAAKSFHWTAFGATGV
jgi:hypothetical protein